MHPDILDRDIKPNNDITRLIGLSRILLMSTYIFTAAKTLYHLDYPLDFFSGSAGIKSGKILGLILFSSFLFYQFTKGFNEIRNINSYRWRNIQFTSIIFTALAGVITLYNIIITFLLAPNPNQEPQQATIIIHIVFVLLFFLLFFDIQNYRNRKNV